MSKETLSWLNQNTLIGLTDKRGNSWHYQASEQGDEPNHYPDFIPVADVERRLFNFEPVERQAAFLVEVDASFVAGVGGVPKGDVIKIGPKYYQVVADPDHKAIVDDRGTVFDYPTLEYAIHTYNQWLIGNVGTLLSQAKGELGISSAGLLRKRAQAWVEISIPETVTTPEGVEFLPNLLASTSLNRTLSTQYQATNRETVCDNTLTLARADERRIWRIKHTSGSLDRIGEAREALGIVWKTAEDFEQAVTAACAVKVSDREWQKVLDACLPVPKDKSQRSQNYVLNQHAALNGLYRKDPRCEPWKGTKFGVLQTFNTWKQHHATIRNANGGGRVERNRVNVINGSLARFDFQIADTVDEVLGLTPAA